VENDEVKARQEESENPRFFRFSFAGLQKIAIAHDASKSKRQIVTVA
jgi:hypothetical protein